MFPYKKKMKTGIKRILPLLFIVTPHLILAQISDEVLESTRQITSGHEDSSTSILGPIVYFIKGGEIFSYDISKQNILQLTKTNGKIRDMAFATDYIHCAFTEKLFQVDDSGEFDEGEEVPKRDVCAIRLYDVHKREIVDTILPDTFDMFVYLGEWLSDRYFHFISCGFFDVSGAFVYDMQNGKITDMHYKFDRLQDYRDSTAIKKRKSKGDNDHVLKVSKSKVSENDTLKFLDATKGKILITSMPEILEPELSRDRKFIAFLSDSSLMIYGVADQTIRKVAKSVVKFSW